MDIKELMQKFSGPTTAICHVDRAGAVGLVIAIAFLNSWNLLSPCGATFTLAGSSPGVG